MVLEKTSTTELFHPGMMNYPAANYGVSINILAGGLTFRYLWKSTAIKPLRRDLIFFEGST
jgi:hypothetical protein